MNKLKIYAFSGAAMLCGAITLSAMQTAQARGVPQPPGVITSRPNGTTGIWVIGGATYQASASTQLDTLEGALSVGACAKVKLGADGTVLEIDSEPAGDCTGANGTAVASQTPRASTPTATREEHNRGRSEDAHERGRGRGRGRRGTDDAVRARSTQTPSPSATPLARATSKPEDGAHRSSGHTPAVTSSSTASAGATPVATATRKPEDGVHRSSDHAAATPGATPTSDDRRTGGGSGSNSGHGNSGDSGGKGGGGSSGKGKK